MRNLSILLCCLMLVGCRAMGSGMLIGGSVANSNFVPARIIASYTPLGNIPEGTEFHLIEHRGRTVMYRKDIDGSGMLLEYHWMEEGNDYYSAAFFGHGDAYIAFVPADRSQEGGMFIYEKGSYEGGPAGFRKRPTPYTPKNEPDIRLIPQ